MKKSNRISLLNRVIKLMIGMFISSIGIQMMIEANMGLDPWNVLNQGLVNSFNMSFSMAIQITGIIIIAIAIILKEKFGIGTLANIFVIAYFVDIIEKMGFIKRQTTILGGSFMLAGAIILIGFGTWMYMSTALGSGPRDALMVAFTKRTKLSPGFCRIITEIGVTVLGYFMGGQVGVGTIISSIGIGLCINFWFKVFKFNAHLTHQENIIKSIKTIIKG